MQTSGRVVVLGGGLAGLAAAARLAKLGHPVELLEATDRLGGSWAAAELEPGVRVDEAPAVLGFPAPWRDLFRKSGRALEAELSRSGWELAAAGPPVYRFSDGSELPLPADRGEQYEVLSGRYGPAVAERWRDLLDALGLVWQTRRPLGLEAEFTPPGRLRRSPALTREACRQLRSRESVADLAGYAGHPHLEALVRSSAYRLGSPPEHVPALAGVELWCERTFGRWQLQRIGRPTGEGAGRTSVLVEALADRLRLRKVKVHLQQPAASLGFGADGIRVSTEDEYAADVVVSALDPWTTAELAGRRAAGSWRPADGPAVGHQLVDQPPGPVREVVELTASGVPRVSYERPLDSGRLVSAHDFTTARPAPAFGLAWNGFADWARRPPLRSAETPRLLSAGPWSVGGPTGAQQILSGALAAYAAHDLAPPPARGADGPQPPRSR